MARNFSCLQEILETIGERIELSEVERELIYRRSDCHFRLTYRSLEIKMQKEKALLNLFHLLNRYGEAFSLAHYEAFLKQQKKLTPLMFIGVVQTRTKDIFEGVYDYLASKEEADHTMTVRAPGRCFW